MASKRFPVAHAKKKKAIRVGRALGDRALPGARRRLIHGFLVGFVVKPGGRFAVYLYSQYGISHRMSDIIRIVTTRLPLRVMWALSAMMSRVTWMSANVSVSDALAVTVPVVGLVNTIVHWPLLSVVPSHVDELWSMTVVEPSESASE